MSQETTIGHPERSGSGAKACPEHSEWNPYGLSQIFFYEST